MSLTTKFINDNLNNNKVFTEPEHININHIIYPDVINIINDISLKNLLYNNNSIIKKNENIKDKKKINKSIKFKKNSFMNELSEALYYRTKIDEDNESKLKNDILNYVNNIKNKDYLIKCNRFYKKLQIKVNNELNVHNTDKSLENLDEVFMIICNIYNINLLIISDNIYKEFISKEENIYLVFDKISINLENDIKKIYKFRDEYENINDLINNMGLYYNLKELNKMKIKELLEVRNNYNVVSIKKIDIINDIWEKCVNF